MEKPNILLITTDQQRFDTIHALGNQHIYTPHLNYLVDKRYYLYPLLYRQSCMHGSEIDNHDR